MTIVFVLFITATLIAAYLAILAVAVVLLDGTLSQGQKIMQCLAAICVPILGPITVLYMAHTVMPQILRWVPWPFRNIVAGTEIKRYSSPEEQSGDSNMY